MNIQRCALCLFCEKLSPEHVRCTNADVAQDLNWNKNYLTHGYLDLSFATNPNYNPCFWFVKKNN